MAEHESATRDAGKVACNLLPNVLSQALRASELAKSLAKAVGASRVAILTWYNAQVQQLNESLEGTGVYVGGVEWDYVILSTVRSTPGGLGALEDEHLLDVALTRAKYGLCVLGTPETLRRINAWACHLATPPKKRFFGPLRSQKPGDSFSAHSSLAPSPRRSRDSSAHVVMRGDAKHAG
eukprot:s1659_g3.t1